MSDVNMRQMLEAGVHFGHQTRFWNPKMAPYIFGDRNRIHIINLEKTLPLFKDALNFVGSIAAKGGTILFVGTKNAAQQIVEEEASRSGMPYVNFRWLGGMLTNFKTVKQSIRRLHELEAMSKDGHFERLGKKEILMLQREKEKLERSLGGIKNMTSMPNAIIVIDVGNEKNAVCEAVTLRIPVVGVVDTNNSPNNIDYIIPGNDDAMRAIRLYAKSFADAIISGRASSSLASVGDEFVELDDRGVVEAAPVAKKKTVAKKAAAGKGDESGAASADAASDDKAATKKTAAKKTAAKKTTAKKAAE